MQIIRKNFPAFVRYSISGVTSFSIDLILLWLFIDVLKQPIIASTALAYVIAVSIHFLISRNLAFTNTRRSLRASYMYFFLVSGAGLIFITGLMYIFVTYIPIHYMASRIIIAGLVGIISFFLHKHISFRIET